MQARANVAGQASTSGNDSLSSVFPCWGTSCAKAKEEMLSACDLQFGCCGKSWCWLGVAMGASLAQGSISTSEPLWRGLDAVPWADCPVSTNELIGEDSPGNH